MTTKTENNKDVGEQFVRAVIPLMKEYTEKLEKIVHQADSLYKSLLKAPAAEKNQLQRASEQFRRFREMATRLSSPVNELNRRVSQMIEHGQLDSELDRVELRLRLAELENATNSATRIDISVPKI